ncbi:MAG: SagB/ThcOx family dehydrogenase [Candidatus Abyssobacteria bacterium SURF_17]|uniref:SagB/ThcOx family dehydrogenase n=1 Tax=Candidatus Abyssobacteria bacterium SURF_17 TaxID=2093361 RepID=A0A419EP63_9BACT|nr:MAG: SagB/ThcOx family dehydrogenase [Candidatus Abyssubacteria bacterium SURF_17]
MKNILLLLTMALLLVPSLAKGETMKEEKILLPKPRYDGKVSFEETIRKRRTIRSFKSDALTLSQLSQLLWAAQGITDERHGYRSAPSGGALYPLDVYAVIGKDGVRELSAGVYRYLPDGHALEKVMEGDKRAEVARASLWQDWMARAPVSLVITSEYGRITCKYGERGVRYAQIEVGHVGQNIFLQAEALGLGAGIVGAFDDNAVAQVIGALPDHEPLLVMPVGYKR